jgi:hypothetical protein
MIMSDELSKKRHSRRLQLDENAINRQVRIAKDYNMHQNSKWKYIEQPHRNHKKHILNCGDSHCSMCGNPRRFFKEKTMQEKRFEQRKLHED